MDLNSWVIFLIFGGLLPYGARTEFRIPRSVTVENRGSWIRSRSGFWLLISSLWTDRTGARWVDYTANVVIKSYWSEGSEWKIINLSGRWIKSEMMWGCGARTYIRWSTTEPGEFALLSGFFLFDGPRILTPCKKRKIRSVAFHFETDVISQSFVVFWETAMLLFLF